MTARSIVRQYALYGTAYHPLPRSPDDAVTDTRYLFMAMPGEITLNAMQAVVEREGLDKLLDGALFPSPNWHQSLSDLYRQDDTPGFEARLLRACARVHAQRVPLLLNRIVGKGTHWAFRAKGRPKAFDDLLLAVRMALATESFVDTAGHTPHATISYWAPTTLPTLKISPPIPWTVDHVLLVKSVGSGRHYRYEQIGAAQPLQQPSQLDLFEP